MPDCLKGIAGKGKRIYLGAGTLRPETMYGQTNCWILPTGKYAAFDIMGDIIIATHRSAKNMAWQDLTSAPGKLDCVLDDILGQDLIGAKLKAPLSALEYVYCLPLLTISMKKGTAIVTSVPSDSPDDYMALKDLKGTTKKGYDLREKYKVKEEWVMPFDVIAIMSVPEVILNPDCKDKGARVDKAAEYYCEWQKVASQQDDKKLKDAHDKVYKAGFYGGIMLMGSQKGGKVEDAKPIIKKEMVEAKQAFLYSEPDKEVMSRSGDECVVALVDQWYLKYGEPEWQKKVIIDRHDELSLSVCPQLTLSLFALN